VRIDVADLWDPRYDDAWRVIPTNLGWKKNGENVMGAGLAKQTALRHPDLPALYGEFCQRVKNYELVPLFAYNKLLLFPVKPLNVARPWLSWNQPADIGLIWRSAEALNRFYRYERVAVPLVGAGNGQLPHVAVLDVLHRFWGGGDKWTLVITRECFSLLSLSGAIQSELLAGKVQ